MAACPQTPARLLVAGEADGCGQKVHNLRVATAELVAGNPPPGLLRFRQPAETLFGPCGDLQALPAANRGDHRLPLADSPKADRAQPPGRGDQLQRDGRAGPRFAPSVWGGSWAIRRETFEQLAIHKAWEGMLSDDLVASNQLHRSRAGGPLRSGLRVDLAGRFRLVRHVRFRAAAVPHYAALCLPLVAAGLGRGNGRQSGLDCLARAAGVHDRSQDDRSHWLPASVLGALYGLGLYRGWAMQSLAAVYSPENLPELRGVRRWHVWASPAVALVQWLGLIASAFGNRVRWRAIDYRLGAGGRVLSKRIVVRESGRKNLVLVLST